jgi:ARC6-like, IMS domain/DnaJ domain
VLIPLDYYRILGLPIQATVEQLQQAHRDRSRQLPRREYSEVAIQKRKQLLDEAFFLLSDAEQRARYDVNFLAKTYDLEPLNGTSGDNGLAGDPASATLSSSTNIEIKDDQPIGALLLLHELGEYELVLNLGRPYISNSKANRDDRSASKQVVRSDIVLTVALAYLELGREQWQQNQYEKAAASLEAGQALLLRESIFPNVRGEMQSDLYKLRPYRILELLALPDEQSANRQRGLQLLRDMLQERGGIDGDGDDRSGLDTDDFLRFIQQLRRYTTAAEQQLLFEREARRPSAVATYLAIYALIARGFAERQPGLIYQAKLMLIQLGRRQDVHLERAICTLLLGQTESASRALELSQEEEPLAFIREHSADPSDLLPGLCLYAERWLQDEVFPHFRDLAHKKTSLREYFADEQVQAHLEAMPNEAEMSNQWVVSGTSPIARPVLEPTNSQPADETGAPAATIAYAAGATALAEGVSTVAQLSPGSAEPSRQFPTTGNGRSQTGEPMRMRPPSLEKANPFSQPDRETPNRLSVRRSSRRPGRGRFKSLKIERLILLALAALLALGLTGLILSKIFGFIARTISGPTLKGEQLSIELTGLPVAIPSAKAVSTTNPGVLTNENAKQIVETWLSIKKAALGQQYEVNKLSEVLVNPALSLWQGKVQDAKRDGMYLTYEHSVNIETVIPNEKDPNQAMIKAQVREAETQFQGGKQADSSDSDLIVSYQVVRQNDRWSIKDWTVDVVN